VQKFPRYGLTQSTARACN